MSNTNKKNIWQLPLTPYVVSFIIPIIVLSVVFIMKGIYPFGDPCFLQTDMYNQYAPFFTELRNRLTSGGSLFYSWNIGGGTNFWTLAAYYLASPTNILLIFVPENLVIEFMSIIIIIRIALCSVTMTYYLNYHQKNTGIRRYWAIIFGIFYALSAYIAAYAWNIMWLEGIALFPLIVLGLDKIIKENKGLLYGVSLGYTILSNYYIGLIICIGIVVYCFVSLLIQPEIYKDFWKKILKFTLYTFLALGIAAIFLFPYIKYFTMTASASDVFEWDWSVFKFSALNLIARQFINVNVVDGLGLYPNIYSGMMVFVFLPLFFMNNKISWRKKVGYSLLLIFFYISFSNAVLTYIWHGFHVARSLPCRESFIYIFFVLVVCYNGLMGVEDRKFSHLGISFGITAGIMVFFVAIKDSLFAGSFSNYTFFYSFLFTFIYIILLLLLRTNKKYIKLFTVIFVLLVGYEAGINFYNTGIETKVRSQYTFWNEDINSALTEIEENEEDLFYRVERMDTPTYNDGALHNYRAYSTFSSCSNHNEVELFHYLGMLGDDLVYISEGSTSFIYSLLNAKYIISEREINLPEAYELIYSNSKMDTKKDSYGEYKERNIYVYKYNYALPLGFTIDKEDILNWEITGDEDTLAGIASQNNLVQNVLDGKDLFEEVTPDTSSQITAKYTIKEDGFYYVERNYAHVYTISIIKNDENDVLTDNNEYSSVLGYLKSGDTIEIIIQVHGDNIKELDFSDFPMTMYRMNNEVLKEFYETLSDEAFIIDSFKDTEIEGHISVSEDDSFLMTTIAAEEGWDVYVDGNKINYEIIEDVFIGIDLSAGEHEIVFKYHVPWFGVSALITFISILIVFAILFREKYIPLVRKMSEKKERKNH